jgi:mono/diheme cytochrome c family protein
MTRSTSRSPWLAAAVAAVPFLAHAPAGAQDAPKPPPQAASQPSDEPVPVFDASVLGNPDTIARGQAVWQAQCRHCHGNSAYPGKAPKLRPGMLEPDFIFDRVTNGFRGMPSWKAVYSLDERKAVVAYIKSDSFSP